MPETLNTDDDACSKQNASMSTECSKIQTENDEVMKLPLLVKNSEKKIIDSIPDESSDTLQTEKMSLDTNTETCLTAITENVKSSVHESDSRNNKVITSGIKTTMCTQSPILEKEQSLIEKEEKSSNGSAAVGPTTLDSSLILRQSAIIEKLQPLIENNGINSNNSIPNKLSEPQRTLEMCTLHDNSSTSSTNELTSLPMQIQGSDTKQTSSNLKETPSSLDVDLSLNQNLLEITDTTMSEENNISIELDTDQSRDFKSVLEISNPQTMSKIQNTSLGLLMEYRSDSSDSESSDSSIETISDNDSSLDRIKMEETLKEIEALDDDVEEVNGNKSKTSNQPKVRGEFLIEDLPPIEDLRITVPEDECIEFGKIHSIVDQLVLVSPLPNSLLLDLDTVLFLEKGQKALGEIFDVLGQVADPLYCIRFNSNEHIKEKGIEVGLVVYAAPKTEHTQFIVLSKITKNRGSDASWEHDVEPPEKFLDYSDDEQEQRARRSFKNNADSANNDSENDQQVKTGRKREWSERGKHQRQHQSYRSSTNYRNYPRNSNPFYYNHSSNHYSNFSNPGFQQRGYVFNPYSIRPPPPSSFSHINVSTPPPNMNVGLFPSHIVSEQRVSHMNTSPSSSHMNARLSSQVHPPSHMSVEQFPNFSSSK